MEIDRTPSRIGKYRVKSEIGRGSQAIVYLCEDPFIGRDVAVKLFYGQQSANIEVSTVVRRKMFFNEVRTAGRLRHPNILPILDAGEEGKSWYLVMEYLGEARPVSEFCTSDTLLPIASVVQLMFKGARALDHAHRQGVIHRDIKPGNLLLAPTGELSICDFGIALDVIADTTEIGGVLGSPSYMSPEQVQGKHVTVQTDFFSLGVVGYELLTGRRPFRGKTLTELIASIVNVDPEPPSSYRAEVTPQIDRIIARMLERDLVKRYADGAELADDLLEAGAEFEKAAGEIAEQERFEMVRDLGFFSEFSYGEIWELLRSSDWVRVGDGERIVEEGEVDDCFYVLVSGEARVTRDEAFITDLQPGDCFGEMALIGRPRTASISAKGNADLLKLRASRLAQLSTDAQLRFNSVFLRTLVERLARSSQR